MGGTCRVRVRRWASAEWPRANPCFPIAVGALVAAVLYEEILRINKNTTGKIRKRQGSARGLVAAPYQDLERP